ncbi:hypothetical protein [Borrelia venezuelensis]|uniref:hypothetical protein n=2 Tax=Borrelia venezuelensis TaxID=1653839 RepID=UPI001FF5C138|nr:hypothetical protein [Borrelia venezuelensis]UPA12750.1 hypothetical protein bvRMA01_001085 [Borrelia venezuelensis]UPA12788.1 hypothetical protein bvRMA01_001134 [Borrelia venezuelensis]
MKRSILSVCMLTLLCLLSCDINALNELLDKSREKFVEENKKLKDLKSKEESQEIKEEQVDIVVRIEEGVKINQKNLQKKGIELELKEKRPGERVEQQQSIFQDNRLTEEEESYLVSYDNEVNEINSKISSKLVIIEAMHSEVSASLSEIESMQANIIKANSDFDRARGFNGNGIDQNVKIKLHQAIEKVKSSRNIAMVWYKEQFNTLENAKSYAEHAKNSTESALRLSAQIRSNGYYGIHYYYISDAKESLGHADDMCAKVESEMGKLRNAMKQVEEDFDNLKRAHEALGFDKK